MDTGMSNDKIAIVNTEMQMLHNTPKPVIA